MINLTRLPARQPLTLTQQTAAAFQAAGALIVDDRRRRSFFFDGRFLTARDLTREQTYFLTRQQDLGAAGGTGVVTGLMVAEGGTATTLTIQAGHGLTPSGELVAVPGDLTLDVAKIADIEMLDAAFGLAPLPRPSARSRTGLYVLALRPVEFTANPVASYPTTLGGTRTIEDGDIVEAVAVTLIPYPDQTSRTELDERRARAAREIFSRGTVRGVPIDALPLAMVALDRGMVHWVDPFLVRREIGAEPLDIVGTGTARRALREAYVLQYQAHLADVLAQPGAERRFAASEHFFALPPAGTLPAAAINPADFTQIYFPPEVDVSLAAIPEDELAPLVRESLSLPPIDLTLSGDDLAWTSVLILIPLPRDVLRRTAGVPPAGSGTPVSSAALVPLGTSLSDPTWRALVGRVDPLWYVRRRNLPYKADVVGQAVDPPLITVDRESAILARLAPIGLDTEYQQLKARASTDLLAEVQLLLSSFPTDHVLLFAGAMHALRASLPDPTPPPPNPAQLTHQMIVNVAALFTDPTRGGGLAKLEDASADFKATPWAAALASAGTWNDLHSGSILQLDALAASRDAAGTLATLVTGLHGIAQPPTAANVANFVKGQS